MAAFLDMKGKLCLVVGGGGVGARRAADLTSFGAQVRVVSPKADAGIRALADAGKLVWHRRVYEPQDVLGCRLVVVATDDPVTNARAAADARKAGAWVNAAFAAGSGDFRIPATFGRGGIRVAVGGVRQSNPRLAAALARYLERLLPAELVRLEEWYTALRVWAAQATGADDADRRRRCFISCTETDAVAAWLSGDESVLANRATAAGGEVPPPPKPSFSAANPTRAADGAGPPA